MLDEVESIANERWGGTALENLRYLVSNSQVASKVSVGLAGGADLEQRLRSAGSSVLNVCRIIDLAPLSDSDIERLINMATGWDAAAISRIVIPLVGGHPFLAQRLLEEFELSNLPRALTPGVRRDALRLVESNMRRLPPDVQRSLISASLGLSKLALMHAELASVAGLTRLEGDSFAIAGDLIADAIRATADERPDEPRSALESLSMSGESSQLEFKSSLRWDMRNASVSRTMESMAVKAVCAFANSKGGTLLLGVDDSGRALGLASDYACLYGGKDEFVRHLRSVLS
jgi:hypothetical protein